MILTLSIAAALAQAPLPAAEAEPAFLVVEVLRTRRPGSVRVEVRADGLSRDYGFTRHRWLPGSRAHRSYTRLGACPAAGPPLERLMSGADPALQIVIGPTRAVTIRADGVHYRLRANLAAGIDRHGTLNLSGPAGTPLAASIETLLFMMESCWQDEAPSPAR